MIASISGSIQRIEESSLVITVGGVGVRVSVPRTVLEDVGGVGRSIYLHTHLIVREQELSLYGFETLDDLHLFEVLLGVNGVGIVCHGGSSPKAIKNAVKMARRHVEKRIQEKLSQNIEQFQEIWESSSRVKSHAN